MFNFDLDNIIYFACGGASSYAFRRFAGIFCKAVLLLGSLASLYAFISRHPKISSGLASVLIGAVLVTAVSGCSSPYVRMDGGSEPYGTVANDIYCASELVSYRIALSAFLVCANEQAVMFVPNLNHIKCADLKSKASSEELIYSSCANDEKSTNVLVNPFNRVRTNL